MPSMVGMKTYGGMLSLAALSMPTLSILPPVPTTPSPTLSHAHATLISPAAATGNGVDSLSSSLAGPSATGSTEHPSKPALSSTVRMPVGRRPPESSAGPGRRFEPSSTCARAAKKSFAKKIGLLPRSIAMSLPACVSKSTQALPLPWSSARWPSSALAPMAAGIARRPITVATEDRPARVRRLALKKASPTIASQVGRRKNRRLLSRPNPAMSQATVRIGPRTQATATAIGWLRTCRPKMARIASPASMVPTIPEMTGGAKAASGNAAMRGHAPCTRPMGVTGM